MFKIINKVRKFAKTFGFKVNTKPSLIPEKNYELRYKLMFEENMEYLEACENEDIVEIADALGDQLYILCGTILEHGLQHKIEDVFNEIQRSNMSKLGEDGKPLYREDGKVIKGPNYFKPNIISVLEQPKKEYPTLSGIKKENLTLLDWGHVCRASSGFTYYLGLSPILQIDEKGNGKILAYEDVPEELLDMIE